MTDSINLGIAAFEHFTLHNVGLRELPQGTDAGDPRLVQFYRFLRRTSATGGRLETAEIGQSHLPLIMAKGIYPDINPEEERT